MKPIDDMREYAIARSLRAKQEGEVSVFEADCDSISYMLDRCELFRKPEDIFFVGVRVEGIHGTVMKLREAPYKSLLDGNGLEAGHRAYAYTGSYDIGHTSADWECVISLGIYGIRERIVNARPSCSDSARQRYYDGLLRVYDAILRFMSRCADFAEKQGCSEMAEGIRCLTWRAPHTLYEAMQCSVIFYTLQRYFDGSIPRTMGRSDTLFYPYYVKESKERAQELCRAYLYALNAFRATANLPFALGGSDETGKTLVNELSYLLLDTYRHADTEHVKLHLLCSEDVPESFIRLALCAVREGKNSIVFLSDKRVIESLLELGEKKEDAIRYHVVGCYECGGRGELTCSCNARVNIPKALEYALNDGVDMLSGERIGLSAPMPKSFEELFREFERQLRYLCDRAREATDLWEAQYANLHAAPIFSATYESAIQKGGDVYCDHGAVYNNSSLNALGLATAADSLYVIKKLVFDEKRMSLEELTDILRSDWRDQELLRLRCKNKIDKFGNGNKEVDTIAKRIVDMLASAVSKKPNRKGGWYRLGLFSIDWRHSFGKRTAASADGRRAGDTLSQNTGATFGADREGATAHLLSVASLNTTATPNGAIADIDLHRSAVAGDNGLSALQATLKTYFELGGFAVQYNVLDTEILKEAKEFPERYPNLQVRLCGWNVLFSTLSEEEKEEFILRSVRSC